MTRKLRLGRIAVLSAVTAALLLPATGGADPIAQKSGAVINYTGLGKVKIAKKMYIYFICSQACNASATTTIKGPATNLTVNASGSLPAGVQGFVQLTPNGSLLKAMKANPGKFKLVNSIQATGTATGTPDSITNTFRVRR